MIDRFILPVLLSALAGYVDAVGFLRLGGLFVSFMSGNSTQLGVGLADPAASDAGLAAALIAIFVAGVVLGAVVSARAGGWGQTAVLALETAILVAACLVSQSWPGYAALVMALAMGVENNVFRIGVTYMTGTLVRMGQAMAAALMGEADRFGWLADFCLWAGLVVGAVAGAAEYHRLELAALWVAAAYTAALTFFVAVRYRLKH